MKTSINELQEGDFVYDVGQGIYAKVMHTHCKWYALIYESEIPEGATIHEVWDSDEQQPVN